MWRRNLYTVWFTQLLSIMGFGFGLPFLPFYIQELGVTDPDMLKIWTGLLSSGPALAMAIMAPVWGNLADRLGKKLMLMRAMIGATIVLAGLASARSAAAVLVFRLLQGLLTGTVTSSATLVASGTPNKNLSYALGFVSSSTFIGLTLGPAVGGIVAEHFGYRISFLIGTVIMFFGFLLVLFLIKEPTPEMAGRSSDTDDPIDKKYLQKQPENTGGTGGKIITPFIILIFILFFFIRLSRVMPNPFLPLFIQDVRGTIAGSARITGLLSGGIGIAAAVSGLTLSRLGDRMDKLKLLSILVACGTVLSVFVTVIPQFLPAVLFLILTYFLIGGVEPLLMSITSEQVDAGSRGFLFGIQTAVGSLAWACSPLIGSFVSIKYSVKSVFLVFSLCLALTWLVSLFVNLKKK